MHVILRVRLRLSGPAVVLDTTALTIDEAVQYVLSLVRQRGLEHAG